MPKQNYSNHTRYYTPHHFIFYPIGGAMLAACIYFADKYPDKKIEFYCIAGAVFMVLWLSYMLRQHYALTLQNRIVRLELRLRYFELTGKRLDLVESKLTFKQIAALRFASDEELPALLERTLNENLKPNAIKKLITHWHPDYMRV